MYDKIWAMMVGLGIIMMISIVAAAIVDEMKMRSFDECIMETNQEVEWCYSKYIK